MSDFNAGDIVMLKSGGPKMTIERSHEAGYARGVVCAWFDGGEVRIATFQQECLVPWQDEKQKTTKPRSLDG